MPLVSGDKGTQRAVVCGEIGGRRLSRSVGDGRSGSGERWDERQAKAALQASSVLGGAVRTNRDSSNPRAGAAAISTAARRLSSRWPARMLAGGGG